MNVRRILTPGLRLAAALLLVLALTGQGVLAADIASPLVGAGPNASAGCADSTEPGLGPPGETPLGLDGFHAAWYGQSGFPTLCPGHTTVVTIAYMNAGSLGWYAGYPGFTAYLGTTGPTPGQDRPSVLGGVDTDWPGTGRPAVQGEAYVGPGQVAYFRFTVRAPATPGGYEVVLRPLIEGMRWMEDPVFFHVTVRSSDASGPPSAATVPRTYSPTTQPDGSRALRVSVLMFHHVEWLPPNADPLRRDLTVSPADFGDMLSYLATSGYHTITAPQLWWSLTTGAPLPPKPVMLTFDDGYADAHDVVMPLLLEYGMVGTFAVTVDLVGQPDHLTPSMVRDLVASGMDIESHSTDHVNVAVLGYDQQVYQLCTSRRVLSDWTGEDVRHFIYPSGDFAPEPSAALNACGYLSAYRKDGGSLQSSDDMYALRRARVHGQEGLMALLSALQQ